MGPWLAVAAVALALPTAVAQSNCEKCATNSQCTYASTSSKNVNVLHAFCGTVSNTFYCCPTLLDGRSQECNPSNTKECRYRSGSSSSGSSSSGSRDTDDDAAAYISYVIPRTPPSRRRRRARPARTPARKRGAAPRPSPS